MAGIEYWDDLRMTINRSPAFEAVLADCIGACGSIWVVADSIIVNSERVEMSYLVIMLQSGGLDCAKSGRPGTVDIGPIEL